MNNDVVVFDVDEFKTLYPQFADVDETILQNYFNAATLLLDNTNKSPVKDLAERKMLLYMLTCHIATLKKRGDTIVGTITAATEGKVNVSITPLVNANWYTQTLCGSMYWQATAKYRLGVRYVDYCRS
nr:MAG TPA: head to tail adaptor [Caudoviricetes sp.]